MGKSITDFPPNPASFPPIHPTLSQWSETFLQQNSWQPCRKLLLLHASCSVIIWPCILTCILPSFPRTALPSAAGPGAGRSPQEPAGPGAVQVSGRDAVPIPPAAFLPWPQAQDTLCALPWWHPWAVIPCVLPVDNERWHRWLRESQHLTENEVIVLGGGTCSFRCLFNIQRWCSVRAGMWAFRCCSMAVHHCTVLSCFSFSGPDRWWCLD